MAKNIVPKRPLGNTGMSVSVLGWGTVKIGRNQKVKYPGGEGFALPSDKEIDQLLDLALETGVTLIDTAPAYGIAEERLGKILGARREKFQIFTKTGEDFQENESHYDFSEKHTKESVERSLKRLRTDYLEGVLLHCPRNDLETITQTPALETLHKLKEQGKIRSVGVSTMSLEGGLKAVELADVVMVSFNPGYRKEEAVIEKATQLKKGVFLKKAFFSGHIEEASSDDPIKTCIETALSLPGVSSLIFGTNKHKHFQENVSKLGEI